MQLVLFVSILILKIFLIYNAVILINSSFQNSSCSGLTTEAVLQKKCHLKILSFISIKSHHLIIVHVSVYITCFFSRLVVNYLPTNFGEDGSFSNRNIMLKCSTCLGSTL